MMHIIASFEYSTSLELALNELERHGVAKKNILGFPLDKRVETGKLFDSIHHSDGVSLFNLATVLGTIFMLFGCIYGFILYLGPIIWGLIGLVVGALLGFSIDLFIYKKKQGDRQKRKGDIHTEVVLIIECDQEKAGKVEEVLWQNRALGLCTVAEKPAFFGEQ
ncbi:hypothetical protein [Texcoconibacillus texcoconensis]|uniref:DUF1269 domain-containing protein n=1 Tax=Texcoconibacillus texcoconensis TaxID=1095777 RepID=A0A840QM63_9BACI|nr:hypothetical protein [Texcoconibacillus texcoconensis]MBB5172469.1 hypothetical protein [Texcoconibacillus texcoconensis]